MLYTWQPSIDIFQKLNMSGILGVQLCVTMNKNSIIIHRNMLVNTLRGKNFWIFKIDGIGINEV